MASFKTEQRRGFRDYFIMHIPGSSIRKADPPTNPSRSVKKRIIITVPEGRGVEFLLIAADAALSIALHKRRCAFP